MDNKTKYCTSCWRELDIAAETCECGARFSVPSTSSEEESPRLTGIERSLLGFSEPPAPPEKESPGQVGSIDEKREVQAKKTKFCSNCGAEMTIRRQICPKCGVRVVMPSAVVPQEAPKKIGLGYILGWLVGGVFFIIGGLTLFSRSFLHGLFIVAGALLLLPPFNDFLKEECKVELSGPLRVVGFVLLLYIGSTFVGAPASAPLQREMLNMDQGEFLSTFGTYSVLTRTQQEDRFKEIKGKYVRWTCSLMDASGNKLMLLCTGEWAALNRPDTYVTLRADQTQKVPALKKYSSITFIARLDGRGVTGYDFGDGEIINVE